MHATTPTREDMNMPILDQYTPDSDRYDGRMPQRRCGDSGITLPEVVLRLFIAGGGGLLPVIATAVIYNPTLPPGGQVFEDGLSKLVALLAVGTYVVWGLAGGIGPVLDKITAAYQQAMQDPVVKQRMADASSEIPSLDKMTGPSLKAHLESEIAKWGPVIKKAGIYAD